jgi:hypothetical protein
MKNRTISPERENEESHDSPQGFARSLLLTVLAIERLPIAGKERGVLNKFNQSPAPKSDYTHPNQELICVE